MAIQELAGSPAFGMSTFGFDYSDGATRVFICDWDEIEQVYNEHYNEVITLPNGRTVICTRITVEPYSAGNSVCPPEPGEKTAKASKAKVTCYYSHYVVYLGGDQYLFGSAERVSTYSDSVSVSTANLTTGEVKNGMPVPLSTPYMSVRMPILSYAVSMTRPGPVPKIAMVYLGHVNSAPFVTPHLGTVWPPGHVLYADLDVHKTWLPGAVTNTSWTMQFLIRPYGMPWDAVYEPTQFKWVIPKYVTNGSSVPVYFYPRADLNLVLSAM